MVDAIQGSKILDNNITFLPVFPHGSNAVEHPAVSSNLVTDAEAVSVVVHGRYSLTASQCLQGTASGLLKGR